MEICITRFDNKTINENTNWKIVNQEICIYGSPIKISENILPNTEVIILEMNNSKNIIEGIGIINNKLVKEDKKKYKIYSDNNYNRFIYKSNYRIDKANLSEYEKIVIENLEYLLFNNKNHCKRGQGIQRLPEFIKKNRDFNYSKFLINLYNNRFVKIDKTKIKIIN